MTLQEFFFHHPRIALAFSAGVDSAYLLWAARHHGAQVQPYFIQTCFQPRFALQDALRLCEQLEVPLKFVYVDILKEDDVRTNPPRRCYHCKTQMFTALREAAQADGYETIIDGTNADDNARNQSAC